MDGHEIYEISINPDSRLWKGENRWTSPGGCTMTYQLRGTSKTGIGTLEGR